jgi:KUP system potassium uptake protein
MVARNEIDITSHFESLHQYKIGAAFRLVIMEKCLAYNNSFGAKEGFILNSIFLSKGWPSRKQKPLGLTPAKPTWKKIPLVVKPVGNIVLKKVEAV